LVSVERVLLYWFQIATEDEACSDGEHGDTDWQANSDNNVVKAV